ncbi:zinc finger, CCHC-type containing protein [Tanacetum coccineum]
MGILYKSMEVQNKLGLNNLVLVLKQESMEYMMINVFGLRWNCKELKGIMKLRFSAFRNGILQWLKDDWWERQPEEKDNTGTCLVKEQEKEYQTGWKIKMGNVLDSCNQRSTQQCMKSGVTKHLGVAGIQQQNGLVDETNVTLFAKVRCFLIQSGMSKVFWAEDTTRSTYLVNRSPSSAIGFKKPIDMLGFFGWLASIKQGMLEPVKVKCIFLGYHKSIVGNKLWRLDDVTSKVVLYRNMGFNESGEYKKTFIGSGVGTGSMQVLHGFEFEVEPLGDHTFEVEPQENVDQGAGEKDLCNKSLTFNITIVVRKCSDDSDGYYWEYTPGMFIHMFLYIDDMNFFADARLRSGLPRIYWIKQREIYLVWRSSGIRVGSLSGDCDVEKNGKWSCIYAVGSQEYQMVCTRPDIASADVGSLKANLHYMETLSTTEAGYVTFTKAWKKEIWLKRLLTEFKDYELRVSRGIATGCLVTAVPYFGGSMHKSRLLRIGID